MAASGLDHVGLRVRGLRKATDLYTKMLAPLGWVFFSEGDGGFGPAGGPPVLTLYENAHGGGAHVGLLTSSRANVDAFHAEGLKAGAKHNGAPGIRASYAPNYYAAFLTDEEGNNIEAYCLE